MNIKRQDALEALRAVAAGTVAVPDTGKWSGGPWGNFYLHEWTARYQGSRLDDTDVPFLAELHHQQLYDPDFPHRWRLLTLRRITGDDDAPAEEAEERALSLTAAHGVTARHLDGEQLDHWLSPAERSRLPERQQILRALARAPWGTC